MEKYYILIFVVLNLVTFFAFGYDKLMAVKKGRRISEKTLLALSFLFSGVGACLGMIVFNHKTSKKLFRFLVPLTLIVNALSIAYFVLSVVK